MYRDKQQSVGSWGNSEEEWWDLPLFCAFKIILLSPVINILRDGLKQNTSIETQKERRSSTENINILNAQHGVNSCPRTVGFHFI